MILEKIETAYITNKSTGEIVFSIDLQCINVLSADEKSYRIIKSLTWFINNSCCCADDFELNLQVIRDNGKRDAVLMPLLWVVIAMESDY